MKVYVVKTGEYSDYYMDKIFVDKAKAEEYSKFRFDSNEYYDIEEWETSDDEIEIGKYEKISYLRMDYYARLLNQGSNDESFHIDVRETNTYTHSDLDAYPYNHKAFRSLSHTEGFQISLTYSNDDNLTLDEIDKDKYLKICRDYMAKAKALHDIDGVPWEDVEEILFK